MLIGGLGLFFVGIRMVRDNLKRMTSRRVKLLITRFTDSGFIAGIGGALSGFITQSTTVVTFIVASFISSGLLTVRKSLPIIFWSNAGCSTLVLIAVFDIKCIVLLVLGLSGICYAFEKPARFHHALGILFGISLLFFGLNMVSTGTSPVAEYPGFQSLLFTLKNSYLLIFLIGGILTVISQAAIGIMIIAITMANAGMFTMDQTLMIIYGVHAGSAATTIILSASVRGSAKQAVMARALLNLFGVVIFVVLFYVELYTHVPLVKTFVGRLSGDIREQAAFVVLLFNFLIPFIFSFLLTPFYSILTHFWPPLEEETLSKIKFIHEHAAGDPDAAILLIDKELLRLLKRIPLYLDRLRPGARDGSIDLDTYHNAFGEVSSEIGLFIADVFHEKLNISTSEALLNAQNRHSLVASLENNVYGLCKTLEGNTDGEASGTLSMNIVESLDAIFLTAIETTASGNADDLEILITLTSDKGGLMEKIRRSYLSSENNLSLDERALILYMTNLYERSIWTLGRYGRSLTPSIVGRAWHQEE